MRGTPWLGSRRGVVITSRSDRVPLLSRRHTLAEKQNGTSDRPTDRPRARPTDRPFSLLSLIFSPLVHPPGSRLFLSFSSLASRFLLGSLSRFRPRRNILEKLSARCPATRETWLLELLESSTSEKPKREKKKRPRREWRDEEELRGESRVPTFSNRLEALEIRFGRLMIGGSGRSSAEHPRATRRNPVSRPSDSRNEGHGKEIPSRRADRKRDWEYH